MMGTTVRLSRRLRGDVSGGARRGVFPVVLAATCAILLAGCFTSEVGDVIPPTTLSTVPTADELFVPVGETIRITFSEPVDGANTTTIAVTDHLGNVVAGSVTGSSTVVFTPDQPLRYSGRYLIQVTTDIRDLAGNALAEPHSWGFSTQPVPVHGGGWHSLAVDDTGTAWAWGANWRGQLGDGAGTLVDSINPTQVAGPGGVGTLQDVVAVSAGNEHSLALLRDGTVWAWGTNYYGELGADTGVDDFSDTPLQVTGPGGTGFLTDVIAISGEYYQSFALLSDGTVWAWGDNTYGQLGVDDGGAGSTSVPLQVLGPGGTGFLTGVMDVSAGYFHTIVLKGDGTVWTWGDESYGELGQGAVSASPYPVQVVGPGGVGVIDDAIAAEAGEWVSAVIRNDGSLWTFGDDTAGFLGDGGVETSSAVPVQVVGPGGSGYLAGVTSVAAGLDQMTACRDDGTVWSWGSNYSAQLGDGTTSASSQVPVQTVTQAGPDISGALGVASTGYYSNYAVMDDGSVLGWGFNDYGELGMVTVENYNGDICSSTAVQVGSLDLTQ